MPAFSIIIPCYNQAHFLSEALESVCDQSFADWEAIIVNDGSADDTLHIAKQWVSRDKRIKLISQQNAGLSAARNAGIAASNGHFITLLDADDKYGPDFLDTALMHLNQGFEMVACGYIYFNNTDNLQRKVSLSEDLNFRNILTGNLFPPVSVAFQKSVLSQTKEFDTNLKSAEDWDLWIRMYRAGVSLSIISENLVYYRVSDNSMSRQPFTMYDSLKEVALRACYIDKRLDQQIEVDIQVVKSLPSTIKKLLMMCMGVAVMQGKIETAVALIIQEMEDHNLVFCPEDFKDMCSYLSFRYRVNHNDLQWIQETLMPLFEQLFHLLSIPYLDKKKANANVFHIHRRLINKKKWGIISPLINQFI